jgi:hypothetical protein
MLASINLDDESGSHMRREEEAELPDEQYFAAVPSNSRLRKRNGHASLDKEQLPIIYIMCFWAVSFGYMCAWTSFGSLISYYKHHFGVEFYTQIYCAYYLPGLPICLLQYKYDTFFDIKYGSHHTFLLRGVLYISVMVFIIISMILLESKMMLILCFVMLGICSWAAHGTASTLAALYPSSCINAMQTGFRSPEVFVVLLTISLDIGSAPGFQHLAQFYTLTAVGVAVGLLSWIVLCTNKRALYYFYEIDKEYQVIYTDSGESAVGTNGTALMATILDGLFFGTIGKPGKDAAEAPLGQWRSPIRSWLDKQNRLLSPSSGSGPWQRRTIYSRHRYVDNNYYLERAPLLGETAGGIENGFPRYKDSPVKGYGSQGGLGLTVAVSLTEKDVDTDGMVENRLSEEEEMEDENYEDDDGSVGSSASHLLMSLSSISRGEIDFPSILIDNIDREGGAELQPLSYSQQTVRHDVVVLCNVLFVTMFTSIFQGSFFVYAKSGSSRNVEQYLYFTRLFCDLLGRPLASLPRPWFVQTDTQLWNGTMWRLLLLLTYFLYIFLPETWVPRSDIFVCSIVGLFSLINGYFAVLIYEYAAHRVEDKGKNAQAYATTLLNITFQISSFLAVVSSVSIVALIDSG